jgi:hypothetical protein
MYYGGSHELVYGGSHELVSRGRLQVLRPENLKLNPKLKSRTLLQVLGHLSAASRTWKAYTSCASRLVLAVLFSFCERESFVRETLSHKKKKSKTFENSTPHARAIWYSLSLFFLFLKSLHLMREPSGTLSLSLSLSHSSLFLSRTHTHTHTCTHTHTHTHTHIWKLLHICKLIHMCICMCNTNT